MQPPSTAKPPAPAAASSPTKFVFVTGGVVSSLGKGIAAASLGRLLVERGLTVTMLKFDPYLNVWFPDYAARGPDRILNRYAFGELFQSEAFTSNTELQFDFATGALTHEVLAGVDYVRHSSTMHSTGGYSGASAIDVNGLPILSLAPSTTPIDAYAPVYGNILTTAFQDDGRQVQTQLGAYIQSQTKLLDTALLVLGLRRAAPREDLLVRPPELDEDGLDPRPAKSPCESHLGDFRALPVGEDHEEAAGDGR